MSTIHYDAKLVHAEIESRYARRERRPRHASSLEVIRRAHARTNREVGTVENSR